MPHARATVAALWSLTLSPGWSLPAIDGISAESAAPQNSQQLFALPKRAGPLLGWLSVRAGIVLARKAI